MDVLVRVIKVLARVMALLARGVKVLANVTKMLARVVKLLVHVMKFLVDGRRCHFSVKEVQKRRKMMVLLEMVYFVLCFVWFSPACVRRT